MSNLPPGMKAFKVIRPYDHVAAEQAGLDDYHKRQHQKNQDKLAAAGIWSFPYPDPKKYFPNGIRFKTSDDKIGDDNVVYQRSFDSSKGVKDKYTVRVNANGLMSCNCMGWSVKKDAHRHCPHCDELINDLNIHMRTK